MGTATSKTETGLNCNTAFTRYVWAYNGCGPSTPTLLTQTTAACSFVCGDPIVINHIAGAVAPVTKTVTYGTVTNIPGETSKCWITSNLGADHQAIAINDATEASAGWYWQFNRQQGYKYDGTTVTPAWTVTSIIENSDWLTINDPCTLSLGGAWRLPTSTEWINVDASGGWVDWNGPWNSALKIHAAGFFWENSIFESRGFLGSYWSKNQEGTVSGLRIFFHPYDSFVNAHTKAMGFSVRCVHD